MLTKAFIQASQSPRGAPVLFVKKKEGTLCLCVNYHMLNWITWKNKYPIPLILNLIDQPNGVNIYTKFDLQADYHNVWMAPGHEWKTAFCTQYGAFKFLVRPMGPTPLWHFNTLWMTSSKTWQMCSWLCYTLMTSWYFWRTSRNIVIMCERF